MPQTACRIVPVRCAPKHHPCPRGGRNGRRVRRLLVLRQFSGTLCVDELHLGRHTLLLATDPIADLPVAVALVEHNDQDHMRRFLGNLKTWGLCPDLVVSDGSSLYPTVLAE